jgi:hypothetical protein
MDEKRHSTCHVQLPQLEKKGLGSREVLGAAHVGSLVGALYVAAATSVLLLPVHFMSSYLLCLTMR